MNYQIEVTRKHWDDALKAMKDKKSALTHCVMGMALNDCFEGEVEAVDFDSALTEDGLRLKFSRKAEELVRIFCLHDSPHTSSDCDVPDFPITVKVSGT